MEIQPSKSSRQKRCLMCHITEHVTLECQEVCSEEQKAMTEIEEMTLLDERKSYRVVVEGFRNNSNCVLTCDPPSFVISKDNVTKQSITFSMFLKNSCFQHDLNIPVYVFEEDTLVSFEKIHISVLPELSDYLDFNEMQYVLQKDLIYPGVYNHIFRGVSRRRIDRHSRSCSSRSNSRQACGA